MDMELMQIQMTQDFEELAEQYSVAASNERLWAKGANDAEQARMHEENAVHNAEMAKLYKYLSIRPLDLVESLMEEN